MKFERKMKSTEKEEEERRSTGLLKKAFEDGTFSYKDLMLGCSRILYGLGKESDLTDRNDNS